VDTRYRERELEVQFLKDPFVHDNHGNVESPPLNNGEQRSEDGPLTQDTLIIHPLVKLRRNPDQELRWESSARFPSFNTLPQIEEKGRL